MEQHACEQRYGHGRIADFEGGTIAATLCEFPCLRGEEGIDESERGRQREIALVVKAEVIPHQEVEVIEIENGREGIQSLEREAGEFDDLSRGHRAAETSAMAVRQYHFTASDIGGCNLSKSASEHQRMS